MFDFIPLCKQFYTIYMVFMEMRNKQNINGGFMRQEITYLLYKPITIWLHATVIYYMLIII